VRVHLPVDVQLVSAVEHKGDLCAGRKVQREGAVQAAAVKPPQLAPRAGAGDDELRRLQRHHSVSAVVAAQRQQLDVGTSVGDIPDRMAAWL
jgi:hypothetical protein